MEHPKFDYIREEEEETVLLNYIYYIADCLVKKFPHLPPPLVFRVTKKVSVQKDAPL